MALDKLVDSSALDTNLTSVANAIRTKCGTSESLAFPAGFVSAIGNIATGTDVSDTTATAGDVLSGKYFYNANGTKTQGNMQLNDIATGVDLSQNTKLTYVQRVETVGNVAFYRNTNLTDVSFPCATSIGNTAFSGCSNLTRASFPSATSIMTSAFQDCYMLTDISLPNATSIYNRAFYNCTILPSLSLPSVTSLGAQVFTNCNSLTTVILGANQVCSLESSFIIPLGITFYVPDNLVNSYKSATNWSDIASQIKGISELPT